MTRTILIDENPVLTRAALIEGEEVVRLTYHHPYRKHPLRGGLYKAKVKEVDGRLNAAYCDLGGMTGFLRRKGKMPSVGSSLVVEVRREPVGGKAAEVSDAPVLRLPTVSIGSDGEARPGAISVSDEAFDIHADRARQHLAVVTDGVAGSHDGVPPVVRLLTELGAQGVDQIDVTSPATRSAIQRYVVSGVSVEVVDAIGARAFLMAAEEEGLARRVDLPGGGRFIIDETEALTAIDLDLGAQRGQSAKGAAEKMLTEALQGLGRQARLADLGGQIIVDIPRGAIAAPKIIRDRLMRTFKSLGRVSVPAVTPEGLGVVIAPKSGPTLLERLTAPMEGGIRQGRALRDDVAASYACHLLEEALADNRTATLTLFVAPSLRQFVTEGGDVLTHLTSIYGPRISVSVDEQLAGQDFPYHVE